MLYVAIWYVSIRPVVMRVKEELQFYLHPHNITLLRSGFIVLVLYFPVYFVISYR